MFRCGMILILGHTGTQQKAQPLRLGFLLFLLMEIISLCGIPVAKACSWDPGITG
jgi:hypothetical protein